MESRLDLDLDRNVEHETDGDNRQMVPEAAYIKQKRML
jgi:hypothetical protein